MVQYEEMGKQNTSRPYQKLGTHLKALRTRLGESLAEASGAVEIDVMELASFELGDRRPAEDVLLLLISHFGAADHEAVQLWEVAGYGSTKTAETPEHGRPAKQSEKTASPVLFTDVVDILVNNYGVIMNFMQNSGPGTAPTSVARVGMSREHAKSILQILQNTLQRTEQSQAHSKNSQPDN